MSTEVRQNVPECEIMLQCGKSAKSAKDHRRWLLFGNKYQKCCINKDFCILLGFGYFDIGISIYLWWRPLTLVVGTAFVMLMNGAKQAGLVVVIGQSRIQ